MSPDRERTPNAGDPETDSEDSILDQAEELLERILAGEVSEDALGALPKSWRDRITTIAEGDRLLRGGSGAGSPIPIPASKLLELPRDLGPYRLLRELGHGGQGTVYLAEDPRLGRRIAIKVLSTNGLREPQRLARFRREAKVASRLDHAGICAVHDVGSDGETAFIAMRYVDGASLAALLSALRTAPLENGTRTAHVDGTLAPDPFTRAGLLATVRFVEDIARSVHAAHEAGIIHRDLKPGNLMLTPSGQAVVLDFGLARAELLDFETLTSQGQAFGTPAYMAPETVEGIQERIDHRADVWSLGAVLYEALTLTRPFVESSRDALYRAILTKSPTSPRELNSLISRDLEAVLFRALEKEPRERYASAFEFAEDLLRFRRHEPVRARPPTTLVRCLRWSRRNKAIATSLCVAVLALLAGLVVALVALKDAKAEQTKTRLALKSEQLAREAAEGAGLAILSREVADRSPGLALLLATRAGIQRPGLEAQNSLLRALQRSHEDTVFYLGSTVHDVAWLAARNRILAASEDGTIAELDLESRNCVSKVQRHRGAALCVAVSPDTDRYATGGADGAVLIFDAHSANPARELQAHKGSVRDVRFSRDGTLLLSVGTDGDAAIWSLADGQCRVRIRALQGPLAAGTFSALGDEIFLVGMLPVVNRFRARDGELLASWPMTWRDVTDIDCSPDGSEIAVASADNTVWLYSIKKPESPRRIRGHGSGVHAVRFGPGGDHLCSVSWDRTLRRTSLRDSAEPSVFRGHERPLNCVAIGPQGLLITGAEDGTVRTWLPEVQRHCLSIRSPEATIIWARPFDEGKKIAAVNELGEFLVIERQTGKTLHRSEPSDSQFVDAALDPKGMFAVLATRRGRLDIRSTSTGAVLRTLQADELAQDQSLELCISPDGTQVLVTSTEGKALLFDTSSGERRGTLKGLAQAFTSIVPSASAFSPDGQLCATSVKEGGVHLAVVYDVATGIRKFVDSGHLAPIMSMGFDPAGKRLLTASLDGTARILDLSRERSPIVLATHQDGIQTAIFSPDGLAVLSASRDGTARLYDATTGRERLVLRGHESMLYEAAFDPTGTRIVTASWDDTARVFDARTGETLLIQEDHDSAVLSASFIDSSTILTFSRSGVLRLWPADPKEAQRGSLERPLTPGEADRLGEVSKRFRIFQKPMNTASEDAL